MSGHGAEVTATFDTVLKKGRNIVKGEMALESPALWWPNGQGTQPLYLLETRLEDIARGMMLDDRKTRFGIRELRWEQVEGAPADFIIPFKLLVNGRPVRTMGSNLIPPDLLFGRIMERGPRLLELAKRAGMSMLRLWGGGVVLPEDMYDLADEYGIMLSFECQWPTAFLKRTLYFYQTLT